MNILAGDLLSVSPFLLLIYPQVACGIYLVGLLQFLLSEATEMFTDGL